MASRLGLTTSGAGLKDFTSIQEIKLLDDSLAQRFVDRADAFLERNGPYERIGYFVDDMATATYLVAESLFLLSDPDARASTAYQYKREKIGTYQYEKYDNKMNDASRVYDPVRDQPEVVDIIRRYQVVDDFPRVISTIVFHELTTNPTTGQRDYKDLSDETFNRVFEDMIVSGTPGARPLF